MKIKIVRPKFVHIESGTYKAHIVSATERGVGNGRKQLQLVMEILNICSFTGCHFNHCIMTDGSAEFYIDRLLKALFKGEFNLNVIDTEDFLYKQILVSLENHYLADGRPNYYPNITEIQGRI